MTEEWANLLVFPFRNNDKLLANCVVIERVSLFTGNILSEDFLAFVTIQFPQCVTPETNAVVCPICFLCHSDGKHPATWGASSVVKRSKP